jgi:hypothetical protein
MHVPTLVERVRVEGRSEVFLVLRVNHDDRAAHVVPLEKPGAAVLKVPFEELTPAGGGGAASRPILRPHAG